jgi:uncharacterized repeat protein (TIGR01451 family)
VANGNFPPSSSLHKQERDATANGVFSDGPITVNPGDTIEYQLTYANSGTGPAVGITITDTLPANTAFVSCSNSCSNVAGVLSWNEGTIQAGGSATVAFQVKVPSTFTSNTYSTSNFGTETDQSGSHQSNTVIANGTYPGGALLHKQEKDVTTGGSYSDGPITARQGDVIQYQLVYTNTGTGPVTNLKITDPIPANTTFVAGSCSLTCTNSAGTLSWTFANVASGGVVTVSFQVTVNSGLPTGTTRIFNTGAASSDQVPGPTSSNTVEADVTIVVVSQITPTQTTCSQFASGTASTLSFVNYATLFGGTTIANDNPGVLFYWVKLTVTSSGLHTYTITQSTTYAPTTGTQYFALAAGSFAYDGSCNTLPTTITGPANNLTVQFSGAPGTYYIGIKYRPKSVVGSGPAATTPGSFYTYTFQTTGVGGSTSSVKLIHQ